MRCTIILITALVCCVSGIYDALFADAVGKPQVARGFEYREEFLPNGFGKMDPTIVDKILKQESKKRSTTGSTTKLVRASSSAAHPAEVQVPPPPPLSVSMNLAFALHLLSRNFIVLSSIVCRRNAFCDVAICLSSRIWFSCRSIVSLLELAKSVRKNCCQGRSTSPKR